MAFVLQKSPFDRLLKKTFFYMKISLSEVNSTEQLIGLFKFVN